MNKLRIFDLIDNALDNFSEKDDVLAGKIDDSWVKYTAKDYKKFADRFSLGLLELGVKKGDKIATISNNRPEWNFIDMGIAQIGAVHTPLYPTLTGKDLEYILRHSDSVLLIVSDKLLYKKMKPIADKIRKLKNIYTINEIDGANNWKEIINIGEKSYATKIDNLEKIKSEVNSDNVFTLIYTSGTTGKPKGVQLTHWNFTYQVQRFKQLLDVNEKHTAISFLPLCHVFERVVNYAMQYLGVSIYYAEGFHKISDNLEEIRPHIFATVPRVLERFYDKIIAKGNALPVIQKKIFFASLNHASKFNFKNNIFYRSQLALYDNLVYSQWRKAFGSRVKYIISGGAALSPQLSKLFWAAGLHIREGYGLTETAPVISLNNMPPKGVKIGTVGKAIGQEQQILIADDGEILFRGPSLMKGYYKADELTNQAIDKDGWFHTGDSGKLDDDGFLTITGRKKDIFKLSNGKYISPSMIENMFIESSLIQQIMVVGENEKFAGALVSPNFEAIEAYAKESDIIYRNKRDLVRNEHIHKYIKKEIIKLNKNLAQFERVNTFRIVCDDWSPSTGELSPTLKKKRNVIEEKYKDLIKEMY